MSLTASFEDVGEEFDNFFSDPEELSRLEARSLDAILGPARARKVLDCACGTGIQALGLAAMGYDVAASDISPRMVRVARRKARAQRLRLKLRVADFRNLSAWEDEKFDAVICSGNSLPLVRSEREVETSLLAMQRVLRPGGTLVVGIHNYRRHRKNGRVTQFVSASGRPGHEIVSIRRFLSGSVDIRYEVTRGRDVMVFRKRYLDLAPRDVARLLEAAGFVGVRTMDVRGRTQFRGGEWALVLGHAPKDHATGSEVRRSPKTSSGRPAKPR